MPTNKTTYVVLLNWKGWQDTIACLQSLFISSYDAMRVIVCDNASGDGSLERIEEWATGKLDAKVPENPRLARLVDEAAPRPKTSRIDKYMAQAGEVDPQAQLILVDNGANLGFSAGNNVGLRLALTQPDMDCVWLLNNDTLVEPDCLAQMRAELHRAGDQAVCGSMIHFYDQPEMLQAIGGNRFNRITGVASRSEGRFQHESHARPDATLEDRLGYLSGCSMLIPRGFLENVGLMNERYFLYYEEIDWFTRARGRYPIRIAELARLYHREGSAIGSPGWKRAATAFSDFHLYRSRMMFMREHYQHFVPLSYMSSLMDALKRVARGQFHNAHAVLTALHKPDTRYKAI